MEYSGRQTLHSGRFTLGRAQLSWKRTARLTSSEHWELALPNLAFIYSRFL